MLPWKRDEATEESDRATDKHLVGLKEKERRRKRGMEKGRETAYIRDNN